MGSIIYGLLMYSAVFVIAAAVQVLFFVKLRKFRLLPICAAVCGLVFCVVLFLPRGLKSDPLFENRYFSVFLATILLTCAVGCLAGWLAAGALRKKKPTDG